MYLSWEAVRAATSDALFRGARGRDFSYWRVALRTFVSREERESSKVFSSFCSRCRVSQRESHKGRAKNDNEQRSS